MNISYMLIKYKVNYIVILSTIIYWMFALTTRFYPEMFMVGGNLRFIHIKLIYLSVIINIFNIFLLFLIIYYKVWEIKYSLIFLIINIITAVIGIHFTSFPIKLM